MDSASVRCQELKVSVLSGGFLFECRSAALITVMHSLYRYIIGRNIEFGHDGSHNMRFTIFSKLCC
jgi:hypothetical protein